MTMIFDSATGESIYGKAEKKYEELVDNIRPKLEKIQKEIDENRKRMYPQKLNFLSAINNYIDTYVRMQERVNYCDAVNIDYEVFKEYYNYWWKLMAFIRDFYPEYFANKQLFAGFCGFSTSAYDAISQGNDGKMVALCESLNDSFVDSNFASAQSGFVSGNSTMSRLKAGGAAGYDVKIKSDSDEVNKTTILITNEENMRKLAKMGFNKMIENKK